MDSSSKPAVWGNADGYEAYMGRWSRLLAREFLAWLAVPSGCRWVDVGCGTGALSRAILDKADPSDVTGIDPSPDFIGYARAQVADPRAGFEVGDAQALPLEPDAYDAVVAGLALNFVPEPAAGLAEMARVTRPGGTVGAYVWDYAGEMQLMRMFWRAAEMLDPAAADQSQARRYPICNREPLAALFSATGLHAVEVRAIDLPATFRDFDDYWQPHLMSGSSPAPRYAMALPKEQQDALREQLRATLPTAPDGSISLILRAWAARGTK